MLAGPFLSSDQDLVVLVQRSAGTRPSRGGDCKEKGLGCAALFAPPLGKEMANRSFRYHEDRPRTELFIVELKTGRCIEECKPVHLVLLFATKLASIDFAYDASRATGCCA